MEQLKVINQAIDLGEFTTKTLAERTGAKLATIHTIVSRHPELFEEIGKESTGRPGGQWARYRTTEAARDFVRKHLYADDVGGARLQAAYQELLWEVREMAAADVAPLLDRTRTLLRDLEKISQPGGNMHEPILEALIAFAEREHKRESIENAISARDELRRHAVRVMDLGLVPLARSILDRVENSALTRRIDNAALATEKIRRKRARAETTFTIEDKNTAFENVLLGDLELES